MTSVFESMNEWEVPAAKINGRSDCCDDDHRRVLGHEEERPAHAGVFGVKSGDELGFSFRQVEWCAVVLSDAADQKQQEARGLIKHVPDRIRHLRGDDA